MPATRILPDRLCGGCGVLFRPRQARTIYCSQGCQILAQHNAYIARWKAGFEKGWTGVTVTVTGYIRRYLLEKFNYSCSVCGWNVRHPVDDAPLVEIDHIDGDAHNCREENLTVLCPNHHAMTPTFRARNKKSGRIRK